MTPKVTLINIPIIGISWVIALETPPKEVQKRPKRGQKGKKESKEVIISGVIYRLNN